MTSFGATKIIRSKCKGKFTIVLDRFYQCWMQITSFSRFISWKPPMNKFINVFNSILELVDELLLNGKIYLINTTNQFIFLGWYTSECQLMITQFSFELTKHHQSANTKDDKPLQRLMKWRSLQLAKNLNHMIQFFIAEMVGFSNSPKFIAHMMHCNIQFCSCEKKMDIILTSN